MATRLSNLQIAAASVVLLAFAIPVHAQDDENPDDPTRGVARISMIQGEVNVRRGDSGELVAAALNAPLMSQDHLQTAAGSRSEIQFDAANLVRLAPDTDLGLAEVQRGRYQLQLGAGTVIYRILRPSRAEAEIDTPSISIRPSGTSALRISVTNDNTTEVTVRSGEANIYSPRGSQLLRSGQTMLVRGSNADPEFQMEAEVARDQFDDWSYNRDRQLLASRSYQYVSTDIYGAEDLDPYGTWVSSSYGYVWAPRVAPGWAPYHSGRWVWADYYGWTWVDTAPWGWAPFHYGRWFQNGRYGWCWWPGPIRQSYLWRPALVGFFGFGGGGSGFSVGIGFGNVGWVPLAPYEPWHAWYGRGWYGGSRWNGLANRAIINNTNIYNVYRNARFNNGVAYTTVNNFGRGSQGFYSGNGAQFRNASLVRGALPLTPERTSLAFTNRAPVAMGQRFASVQNTHFFTRMQASSIQRVPFRDQQLHMAQFQERTLGTRPNLASDHTRDGFTRTGTFSNAPRSFDNQAQRGFRQVAPAGQQPQDSGGWRRFGQGSPSSFPNTSTGSPRPEQNRARIMSQESRPNAPNNNSGSRGGSGWHRFGDPGSGSYSRPADRPPATSRSEGSGWHSFGSPSDYGQSWRSGPNRNENSFRDQRQSSRPETNRRFQEPMRMNQPIVHDRPSYSAPRSESHYNAPRYSAPSGSGSRYGGGHSNSSVGHSGGGGGGRHR
jgi:hypothetical protein